MSDFAPLGFLIDTGPLKQAQAEARKTADELGSMADKADKASRAAQRRAEIAKIALENERKATKETTDETNKSVAALEAATRKAENYAAAKQREAQAARQAAEAAKAHADAHGKASTSLSEFAQKAANATNSARGMSGELSGMLTTIGTGGAGGVTGALSSATGMFGRLASMAGPAGAAVAGVAAAFVGVPIAVYKSMEYLGRFEDRLEQTRARLSNTLKDSVAGNNALRGLQNMSQGTGLGFQSTSESALRLLRTREDIGATTSEIMTMTELTQKLGRVSGAGQGEIAGGMLQLSQALSSGRLQGDELRSIMEQMPALAKAIADGLGVSVGQLRSMGSEGQLTSDKVFAALLSQAQKIRDEFAKLPETMEQAETRLSDSFDRLMANMGRKVGSSGVVQGVLGATNRVVAGAADMLEDPTIADMRERRAYLANEVYRRSTALNPRYAATAGPMKAELENLTELIRRQEQLNAIREKQESDVKSNAAINRAKVIADQTLKLAATQKEAAVSSKTLEDGIAQLQRKLEERWTEEGVKQLNSLQSALVAVRQQADSAKDALAKYQDETAKMATARLQFGGADVGFGMEVNKLIEAAAADGRSVTPADASAAVVARRLEEARAKAEKEAGAIKSLEESVRVAGASRDALARTQAEQQAALELGSAAAASDEGKRLIKQAGDAAVRQAQLQRQQRDAASMLAPEPRATGDVLRDIDSIKRETDNLLSMRGMEAGERNAAKFAATLTKELKTVPDALKEAYAAARREQFAAEQQAATADFLKGYADNLQTSKDQLQVERLIGSERDTALAMMQIANAARQRGIDLGKEDLATIRDTVQQQQQVNKELERQREAVRELDQFRSTSRSAISSLIKGDTKAAGQAFIDMFTNKGIDSITQMMLGKNGEAGGGLFGNIIGSMFGTGVGQRGSSPANPLFVTMAGAGGIGGLFGSGGNAGTDGFKANTTLGELLGLGGKAGASSGGMGSFGTAGNYRAGVDPRLTDILEKAAVEGGFNVKAISGLRPGDPRFHGKGMATDVSLFDTAGKALPNYQNGAAFASYEKFSQTARMVQMRDYPDLADKFRWGGYFGGSRGKYGALDTMHFDVGGGKVGMGGGSWAGGLNQTQRNFFPDAQSTGMAAFEKTLTNTSSSLTTLTKAASSSTTGLNNFGNAATKLVSSGGSALGGLPGIGGAGGAAGGAGGGGGIFSAIGGLFKGITGLIGGLFKGIGGIFGGILGAIFHDGSDDIGLGSSRMRMLPATAFMHAPRYHSGVNLAGDERAAILQTGERVLSRMDNARLVAGVEAMGRRSEAPQMARQGSTVYQTVNNDFRGVDPSMRAYINSQIQQSQKQTVDASVNAVRTRSQNIPGFLDK